MLAEVAIRSVAKVLQADLASVTLGEVQDERRSAAWLTLYLDARRGLSKSISMIPQ